MELRGSWLRCLIFRRPKLPQVIAVPDPTREDSSVVQLDAPEVCPFYAARLIRGIRVGPSPRMAAAKVGGGWVALDQ